MTTKPTGPMTTFAQQALAISDLIGMKFKGTRLGGSIPRIIKVQAPVMESTGGGKQARESIVLTPENGDTQGNVVCGFVDVKLRAAELRTFRALDLMNRARHKLAIDLSKADYEKFVTDAKAFFEGEGFVVKVNDEAPTMAADAAKKPAGGGGGNTMLYVVIGGFVVAAIGLVAFILMK